MLTNLNIYFSKKIQWNFIIILSPCTKAKAYKMTCPCVVKYNENNCNVNASTLHRTDGLDWKMNYFQDVTALESVW